jgi:hypothetical protein
MRFAGVRRVVAAVIAVIVLNTAMAPFVWAATPAHTSDGPMAAIHCTKMVMAHHEYGSEMTIPCDCSKLACMLQMGCLGVSVGLPPGVQLTEVSVAYKSVTYSSRELHGSGLEPTPEPLPPRSVSF